MPRFPVALSSSEGDKSMSKLVTVWELEIDVTVTITDEGIETLRTWLRGWETIQREAGIPFVWTIYGTSVIVKSEGEPQTLMTLAGHAFEDGLSKPSAIRLKRLRTRPLDSGL